MAPDRDHGSEATGADTAHGVHAVLQVRRDLAWRYPQPAGKVVQHALSALYMAGGAKADMDLMSPFGLRLKK